ncbi:helix-turn-helix domain-containing protein [Dactylosporangium salmoneum]|uniref:HTH cro/C1-type domain-containing protein n=1 Tax=Dactylosporangium salmoneum TaxID=53361 RepID=A0ABN3H3K5_9ACTN
MSPVADHDPQNAGAGFAAALRTRRLARGLTQDELATRAGLGVRTLRELERGRVSRPQRNTVALLADALALTGPDREAFLAASAGRPRARDSIPDAPRTLDAQLVPYVAEAAPNTNGWATRFRETPREDPDSRKVPDNRAREASSTPAMSSARAASDAPAQGGTSAGPQQAPPSKDPSAPSAGRNQQASAGPLPLPTLPPLVGRATDIAELLELLGAPEPDAAVGSGRAGFASDRAAMAPQPGAAAEVIALIGMAGVGKSGLAHSVAHSVALAGWTAVSVTVTNVSEPTDIFSAVAAVFGVARADELVERYAGRRALLVLDGVDRSHRAAVEAIGWLRARVPSVRILATSRRPLAAELPGAVDWQVQPLEVPAAADIETVRRNPAAATDIETARRNPAAATDIETARRNPAAATDIETARRNPAAAADIETVLRNPAAADIEAVRRNPAVALFVERLRLVRREPARDDEIATIAELVRRLDGLPLAIELAAARGRVLELAELLSRYGNRVLALAPTDPADPAGRRLRDAVAASYELLSEREQAALRRLSTLRGRWSVELAEALLDGVVEDVVAVLDRLVGLGLVSVRGPGDLRFRLLDVVLDFAAERCADAGELRAARLRHAEVITRVAVRVSADLTGPASAEAVARLDYLNSDIRSALRYAAVREPEVALRLAGAIPRWCRLRGRDVEAYHLLRRLLDDRRTRDCDPGVRAWAQVGAAMLAMAHGQGVRELCATEAALQVLAGRGDVAGELTARALLAGIWQALGGADEARRHNEVVLGLAIRAGRPREIAVAQNNLAWTDILAGDLTTAARRLAGAGRRAAEAGDARLRALTEANLAEVARLDGRFDEAVDLARGAAAAIGEVGDPIHRVRVLGTLGQAFAEAGRPDEAARVVSELAAVPGSAGTTAMIEGYLALSRGDRPAAAGAFQSAADLLAGRDDIRDVLEALTGLAASADPPRRARAVEDLTGLRERARMALLPRERRLLAHLEGTDEDPLAAMSRLPT